LSEEIREIGIEKELFLLDSDGNIMEPKLFGFPRDEFEFLVEIRSLPSDRLYPVYTTLQQEELQYKLRANKFGMELIDIPVKLAEPEWVDAHWKKHNLNNKDNSDHTKNIYYDYTYKTMITRNHHMEWHIPTIQQKTHHLGVLSLIDDEKTLTAGMHVHFSSRDANTGEVIDLPVEDIVKKMDKVFAFEVGHNNRIKGEWEPKAHGFEYRSLPCNVDIYKVLKESFKILREV